MNSFVDSVDLLSRAMDVVQLRYQVSANNLANAGTPNYKKQSVNFESELKRAFESRDNAHETFRLNATDPGHFTSDVPKDWRSVEPRRVTDFTTTAKANGNNVDAEQEAMNSVKLQMQFRLLTQMQSFEFSQVNIAMKDVR